VGGLREIESEKKKSLQLVMMNRLMFQGVPNPSN
jgi:hypothetical protein